MPRQLTTLDMELFSLSFYLLFWLVPTHRAPVNCGIGWLALGIRGKRRRVTSVNLIEMISSESISSRLNVDE